MSYGFKNCNLYVRVYLLVVASIVPLSAALKRTFPMRRLFLVANTFFLVGVVLDAIAPVFWILLLGRAVQGFGTGIALPLMYNIILEQVPRSKIGMMMGVGTLITGIAPAIGPTYGGLIVSLLSWRWIFIILLPVLMFLLVLGALCVQQSSKLASTHVDAPSIALIVVAFVGLVFGMSNLGTTVFLSLKVDGSLIVGTVALLLFTHRSNRLTYPVLNLRPFIILAFTEHVIGFWLFQMCSLGLSFVLPNYLQLVNGVTALAAGLIVLPGAAVGAVLAPISRQLYDHFGARRPIQVGVSFAVLGVLGLFLAGNQISNGIIIVFYLVYMLGVGLSFGNVLTNALAQLGPTQQADGNAIMTTLQQIAAAMGTSLASAVVASGQAARTIQTTGTALGSHWAMAMLVGFVVIGQVTLTLALRPHKQSFKV
ncbi:MFS transporter [Lacticaseibacillus paracasei]|nr:MFS transporter [Lacticaseibacillus paracasei]